MTLHEMRARIPVGDRAVYEAAYADAALSSRIGETVFALRTAAGMGEAELALRMGVEAEEVVEAEEGAPVDVAFLRRFCAALGLSGAIVVGDRTLDIEAGDGAGTTTKEPR